MPNKPRNVDEALDLGEIEHRLRARHDELHRRVAELAKAPERGAQLSFGKRIGDGTTEAITRITEAGVGESLESSEARVVRALAKLEEGTYGTGDVCGEPIASARLSAAPESAVCIDCARRRSR